MYSIVKKIIIALFVFTVFMADIVFAENINMNFFYGINNVAKNGSRLPIELRIENRDAQKFSGYANINVYESNRSIYSYMIELNVGAKTQAVYNKNISLANRPSTITIDIYNGKEELITSERTSIDLSYFADRMIVGTVTSDFNSLLYLDDNIFSTSTLRTKLVEINSEMYERNKGIFDQIDVLLISDVNVENFSDSFRYAINNFYQSGKPVIISLGGENGVYTLPQSLYQYVSGPIADEKTNIKIYDRTINANISRYHFNGAKKLYDCGNNIFVESLRTGNALVICTPFSFNELSSRRENSDIFINVVEAGLGKNRLDRMQNQINAMSSNDFYNISNLLNMVDRNNLPDIFLISTMLTLYLAIIIVVIYVYLRNVNMRHIYGTCVVVVSIIFTCVMVYMGYRTMKKNTFLTYMSIVDAQDESTKENAFLNFRTSEKGSYEFNTSANNKISPIVRPNYEPILSENFLDIKDTKLTKLTQLNNRIVINVDNASDFDSNMFLYENSNYLNDVYNIDCELSRFNGEISGRITNNMDIRISDASILMYGRVLKIGDIEPNRSVTLTRGINYVSPVGNNSMLSEILGTGNNQNILKYYLDENIYEYFPYAILFGFIDNNGTLDISSSDVGDVYGRTLIVRRITPDQKNDMYDICAFEEEVSNIEGNFDEGNNSTTGETDVINEYAFDNSYFLSNVYFEELSSYDQGQLNYNVPFYGEILAFNRKSATYDRIYENTITFDNLDKYLSNDNKIIIKFSPTSRDPLYRKISLPMVRAIGSK